MASAPSVAMSATRRTPPCRRIKWSSCLPSPPLLTTLDRSVASARTDSDTADRPVGHRHGRFPRTMLAFCQRSPAARGPSALGPHRGRTTSCRIPSPSSTEGPNNQAVAPWPPPAEGARFASYVHPYRHARGHGRPAHDRTDCGPQQDRLGHVESENQNMAAVDAYKSALRPVAGHVVAVEHLGFPGQRQDLRCRVSPVPSPPTWSTS